ncbi:MULTISPECIES: TetR/AcrR family transcriptional regulator [Microbacteriaceae]|uniref:TetR/AcrR family transcriptional regulator n=1 Tax=Microbacteriaceae TaxID=85023 RepID=UPI000832EAF8|nr:MULTISPECIES: TetR/AcrR family transcriptional regulator [Microbacteriaceae]QZY51315.1 TetR family transcriptional regulator [Leucobacter tenebrionis]
MSSAGPRRSPKPGERRRDPERTRARILDAATSEFAAHGYAGARVGSIAARAGVNQQLISYYFDGKEGLAKAISERWREREDELVSSDMPLPEKIRHYALEALHNPESVRLLAWSGLEYDGPQGDPDYASRSERLSRNAEQIRQLQVDGQLDDGIDPTVLMVMLMGAAMAPTFLPHVIQGLTGADPTSEEFLRAYAGQIERLAEIILRDSDRR